MGAKSFIKNIRAGNIGAAIVDGLGVVVDAAATVVPYVPGGVGAGIKAVRGVDKVVDAIDNAGDAAKGVDNLKGGRLGGGTHRERITTKADDLLTDGWEITGGGGKLKEEYIPGPTKGTTKGSNYADITATKDGKTLRVQVGKQTKSGQPVSRERTNLVEIQKKKPNDQVEFLPYNK